MREIKTPLLTVDVIIRSVTASSHRTEELPTRMGPPRRVRRGGGFGRDGGQCGRQRSNSLDVALDGLFQSIPSLIATPGSYRLGGLHGTGAGSLMGRDDARQDGYSGARPARPIAFDHG